MKSPNSFSLFCKPSVIWTQPSLFWGGAVRRLSSSLSPELWRDPAPDLWGPQLYSQSSGLEGKGKHYLVHMSSLTDIIYIQPAQQCFTLELLNVAPSLVHKMFITDSWWGEYRNRKKAFRNCWSNLVVIFLFCLESNNKTWEMSFYFVSLFKISFVY